MSNSPKVTKKQVGLRLELTMCRAVEKKYGRIGDKEKSVAYVRALEESTRDVLLTPEDLDIVASEMRRNREKKSARKIGGVK